MMMTTTTIKDFEVNYQLLVMRELILRIKTILNN